MTTQSTTATAGNPMKNRTFTATATDGTWNNMTSSLSSQAIGLELPGVTINSLNLIYAGGIAIARIIDGKTLKVKSHHLGNKAGFSCQSESGIKPLSLSSSDLLQVYPRAVNATSNDTEVIGIVTTSSGNLPFEATTTSDNTAEELKELNTNQGVGDVFFQSTLMGFQFACEDGATLNRITLVDQQGGEQGSWYGTVRAQAGSKSNIFNVEVQTKIALQKGWKMYVYATTA